MCALSHPPVGDAVMSPTLAWTQLYVGSLVGCGFFGLLLLGTGGWPRAALAMIVTSMALFACVMRDMWRWVRCNEQVL